MGEKIDISALKSSMNGGNKYQDNKNQGYKKGNYKGNYSNNSGYNSKNNQNYGNRSYGGNDGPRYIGAPYNFASFNKKTIPADAKQMLVHGAMNKSLLSGEIAYTLTAQTPVFIDDGTEQHDFVKNARNQYAIPGSSMRGNIRSNVQILGLSSFEQDIDDYSLMYRNITTGVEKKRYNDVLGNKPVAVIPGKKPMGVLTHVKAGYIAKKNGGYVIYKTKVDKISPLLEEMNYYVFSERAVAEDMSSGKTNFPYFESHPEVLQHIMSKGFTPKGSGTHVQYEGTANNSYKPGYYKVSYKVKNLKNVAAVADENTFADKGNLVCTGSMKMKKALYVVPEIDKSKVEIEIPEVDVRAFRIDFEKKKNTLTRTHNVDYFNLPKDGEEKPVFYIELDGHLYFGFTPRLRLFYDHSVKEGYRQEQASFDYAKSLFGTIDGKIGYRSKVSFSDAIAYSADRYDEKKVILGEPKATSYCDYVDQSKGGKTYNAPDFELRGVKQYWLHKGIDIPEFSVHNEKVYSKIRALDKGTVFKGTVRFQNLTEAELGLLLWSIRLESDSWMNIGKAKAFGFGAVAVSDLQVKTLDLDRAYSFDGNLNLDPFVKGDVSAFISAYKKEAESKLGEKVEDQTSVKEFLMMKDSTCIPAPNKIKYMSLKDYQSRTAPLQKVSEVAKKK